MHLRDSEGYIIIPEESLSVSSLSPLSESTQPSSLVTTYGALQNQLTCLCSSIAYFLEHQLFTRASFQFFSKYLLYPLLSGAFSATFAYIRRRP